MGNLFGATLKTSKGSRDATSSWRIFSYALEVFAEFAGGLSQGIIVFTLATLFVGITPDPTSTVVMTNDRWQLLLMPLAFAFITGTLRGSFASTFLADVFFNSWNTLMLALSAMLDGRFNKSWAKVVLPLLFIAANSAGLISAAAWFKAMFGGSAISPFLIPTLSNAVLVSYGWSYLASALVYTLLLHIVVLTYNSTGDFYGSIPIVSWGTFLFGIMQFICLRQLPSFAFNWAYAYLTGFYDILWIDVVGGFTGIVITGVLWWFFWQSYFELDQAQERRNYHDAFSSTVYPPTIKKYVVPKEKQPVKRTPQQQTESGALIRTNNTAFM